MALDSVLYGPASTLFGIESAAREAGYGVSVARDVPLVAVADTDEPLVPITTVDHRDGARRATDHLFALGHQIVWHIAGPHDWLESEARENGWRTVVAQHGAPEPPVLRGDWSPRSGYEAGRELLGRYRDVEAVFVANDQMALGLLRALSEAGVSVPDEVRIVGFDDIPEVAYFSPPLTTVRQDFIALGRLTFGQLRRVIEGMPVEKRCIV